MQERLHQEESYVKYFRENPSTECTTLDLWGISTLLVLNPTQRTISRAEPDGVVQPLGNDWLGLEWQWKNSCAQHRTQSCPEILDRAAGSVLEYNVEHRG